MKYISKHIFLFLALMGAFGALGMNAGKGQMEMPGIVLISEGTSSYCCDGTKVKRSTWKKARKWSKVAAREKLKEASSNARERWFEIPQEGPNYRLQPDSPQIGFGLTYAYNRYRHGLGELDLLDWKYQVQDSNTGHSSPPHDCLVCVRTKRLRPYSGRK